MLQWTDLLKTPELIAMHANMMPSVWYLVLPAIAVLSVYTGYRFWNWKLDLDFNEAYAPCGFIGLFGCVSKVVCYSTTAFTAVNFPHWEFLSLYLVVVSTATVVLGMLVDIPLLIVVVALERRTGKPFSELFQEYFFRTALGIMLITLIITFV